MFCRIAQLTVSLPIAGVYTSRYRDYLIEPVDKPQITISSELFRYDYYGDNISPDVIKYRECGRLFSTALFDYHGFIIHASAVMYKGYAYLFSGSSGIGKSTHAKLWIRMLGEENCVIINDDKPAIRKIGNLWYTFGTQWSVKDAIQCNTEAKLAGICFLKQSNRNKIRRIQGTEACFMVLNHSQHRFRDFDKSAKKLDLVDEIIRDIPLYELENLPELDAAKLSFDTMTSNIM